jgi:hypothetical protein
MERHLVDTVYAGKHYAFYQKSFEQGGPNPVLSFGPVDVTLEQLFAQGMTLFAEGWQTSLSSPRRLRIYLVKKTGSAGVNRQLFRVGSAHFSCLMEKSLQHFVKKEASQVCGHMTFPWWFDDPLEAASRLYGKEKKRPAPMVGNQTLKQYVSQLP